MCRRKSDHHFVSDRLIGGQKLGRQLGIARLLRCQRGHKAAIQICDAIGRVQTVIALATSITAQSCQRQ